MAMSTTVNVELGYAGLAAAVTLHRDESAVLDRAAVLVRRLGGGITLVHALGGMPFVDEDLYATGALEEALEGLSRAAEERLAELRAARPEVPDSMLVTGRTWSAVNHAAAQRGLGLIVVGFHAHLTLLGSTAESVVHHAERDVLVVRTDRYEEQGPAEYRHVMAATDLGGRSLHAVRKAALLAGALEARLTLAHAVERFPVDRENDHIPPENRDPLEYRRELMVQRLVDLAAEVGRPDAQCRVAVTEGGAARAVAGLVESCGADLLVIGGHRHRGVATLFGDTADGIVHHAGCDVLVVRDQSH
jgi:universal stress protein A